MIVAITPETFDAVLERHTGYLVNVWPGHGAKAHALAHLHGGCRKNMLKASHQTKLFASTWPEAQEAARRYHEEAALCRHCARVTPAGRRL
jgi:hypothetical protein